MSSTPPQSTNPVGALVVSIISGLTTGVEIPVIEAAAEAQLPFLGAPVVHEVFDWIVKELAGKLAIEEEGIALKVVFNVENTSKLHAVVASAKAIQDANKSGDQGAIDDATKNAIDQWGNFIHWGGTAPVSS